MLFSRASGAVAVLHTNGEMMVSQVSSAVLVVRALLNKVWQPKLLLDLLYAVGHHRWQLLVALHELQALQRSITLGVATCTAPQRLPVWPWQSHEPLQV